MVKRDKKSLPKEWKCYRIKPNKMMFWQENLDHKFSQVICKKENNEWIINDISYEL